MSNFDRLYRRSFLTHMFCKGWGNPDLILRLIENHKSVSKRETCRHLIKSFNVTTKKQTETSKSVFVEGSFMSPFHSLIPDVMDENNRVARFQLLLPKTWNTKYKPLCIHFAGTGDHYYYRRRIFLANRLLENGIASLIHINPYYGERKPKDQKGSSLNYLSDLFVMGGSLILETNVLLQWAKNEGFDPLAVHGISMGGHMACLGVSVYPEPVCLIPCLSWTTASHVFTQGAMSASVNWNILSKQYNSNEMYSKDIRNAIDPPIPLHLQKTDLSRLSDAKSNISGHEEIKLKVPIDIIDRKYHFLVLKRDSCDSNRRYYCSEKSIENQKMSKFQNFRNNFSWSYLLKPGSFVLFNDRKNKLASENLMNIKKLDFKSNQIHTFDRILYKSIRVENTTFEFMRDMLDFFTHLGNYSVPCDSRLVTVVVAENDAYIPTDGVSHFHDVWDSSCDIRVMKKSGHIGAYLRCSLWRQNSFEAAIVDTMNRYLELYYNEEGPFVSN